MFNKELLLKYKGTLDTIKRLYTEDCHALVVTFGPTQVDIEPLDEDDSALPGVEYLYSDLINFDRDEFIAVLEHTFGEVYVEEDEF